MNDTDLAAARTFHSRLVALLRVEFASLGAFLEALAEFDRRKLFRDLGHAHLFAYLHKGLRLSRGAAHYRCAAAWLVQRFPEVLEPIRDGRLCFTTVAVLASVVTEGNLAAVLPRFYGLSKKEALELAAELKPRTVVPTRTVVTQVEAAGSPVVVRAETSQGQVADPTKVHPGELWAPRTEEERTTIEPMTATASRMHVTVSREFLVLLKKAKAGQSHVQPGASDEEVLTAALELLIEKQTRRKACVPAKVKREVVKRDQGKCQWNLADGGVCGATVRLEIDHVVPRGKGGRSTVENCRILCRAHNLEAARQVYGDAHMDLFTRGGSPGGGPLAREDVAVYEAGPRPPRPCRSQSGFGDSSDWCAPGGEGPDNSIVGKSDWRRAGTAADADQDAGRLPGAVRRKRRIAGEARGRSGPLACKRLIRR
jgi:5-methylcytosine-specific restriction endonuclease McrA